MSNKRRFYDEKRNDAPKTDTEINIHLKEGVSEITMSGLSSITEKRSYNGDNIPLTKRRKENLTPELATNSKYMKSNGKYNPQSIENNDSIDKLSYVRSCYKEICQKLKMQQSDQIQKYLMESRDRVLELANKKHKTKFIHEIERLPSNSCKKTSSILSNLSLYRDRDSQDKFFFFQTSLNEGNGVNCDNLSNKTRSMSKNIDHGITIKLRKKNGNQISQNLNPSIFLEGVHKARPPHTTTVFLRSHLYTEDEQNLTYVPYFGDDDKEDVVSDVFDIDKRERMLKIGPEYRELHRNNMIDKIIRLLSKHKGLKKYFENLNENIDDSCDVYEMYKELAMILDLDIDQILDRHYKYFSNAKEGSIDASKKNNGEKNCAESLKSCENKNKHQSKILEYEELMDSYRNLFCRRCFTYDCNFHGNLEKPNIELQGELAVQKEKEQNWQSICLPVPNETTKHENIDQISHKHHNTSIELSPLQMSLCERAYLIFQGDTLKIATALNVSHDQIKEYVNKQKFTLKAPTHILPYIKQKQKKYRGKKDISMRNYNLSWLKRVQGAEIHPAFQPCNHNGLCSEENCSCVQNSYFCTKHCVWGAKSKNFFRGCACKGNQCRTKACPCFAANRECDPDLCKSCGACTDSPNKPATKQQCRNDNIAMRRHCHLLLGESSIENAGWGIFTKYGLKKGDYVHEYVGEVISQEEAERRGRVYDKVNRSYLFNLTSDYVVDASRKGNKTKFANHSSKPNCFTKMLNVNGDIRIGLFASHDIEPQSELFFDYRYNVEMDNHLILKPGKTVDWMKNPKMANQIRKKAS